MAKMSNLVIKIDDDDGEPEKGWDAWMEKPSKLFGTCIAFTI
jgi:hypothetical protein